MSSSEGDEYSSDEGEASNSSEEEEYEEFSSGSDTEEGNESDFGDFAAAVRCGATTDRLTAMLAGVTTLDIAGLRFPIPLSIVYTCEYV
jgi:hypothetical protein